MGTKPGSHTEFKYIAVFREVNLYRLVGDVSVGCCFVLLTVSFALQKLLSFRRSHLLIVSLSVCAAGVIFRKWSPVPMCSSVLPNFSSITFSVVGFMLRSMIHLDLSFVYGGRYGLFSFFYM